MTRTVFSDRREGGAMLASHLEHLHDRRDVVVLALPRGGVPVGAEVAAALDAPLDVLLVRKLGTPGHTELAMGAIASGGVQVLNDELVRLLGIGEDDVARVATEQWVELERREERYREGHPAVEVAGRTIVLVDDGMATGSTMQAAVASLRQRGPASIIAAVPAAAREACRELEQLADEVVCASTPEPFQAVGAWYRRFEQTTDDEVIDLLGRARDRMAEPATGRRGSG